jgi:hypothetical protein
MTTYAVIRKSDRVEVYRYTADAPIEWDGMGFDEYDHVVVPDPVPPPPPPPPRFVWTGIDFLRRFTVTERIAARTGRTTDPILNDFFSLLEMADIAHSDDQDVIAGMGYLVMIGILTAARRNEILGIA